VAGGEGKAMGTASGADLSGAGEPVAGEQVTPQAGAVPAGVDAARLRELVLRAHPEAIPELVQGETLEELEASARLATEVYRRIADSVREAVAREAAASVPAGQPGRQTYLVNVEALSPAAKIAEGLRRRAE